MLAQTVRILVRWCSLCMEMSMFLTPSRSILPTATVSTSYYIQLLLHHRMSTSANIWNSNCNCHWDYRFQDCLDQGSSAGKVYGRYRVFSKRKNDAAFLSAGPVFFTTVPSSAGGRLPNAMGSEDTKPLVLPPLSPEWSPGSEFQHQKSMQPETLTTQPWNQVKWTRKWIQATRNLQQAIMELGNEPWKLHQASMQPSPGIQVLNSDNQEPLPGNHWGMCMESGSESRQPGNPVKVTQKWSQAFRDIHCATMEPNTGNQEVIQTASNFHQATSVPRTEKRKSTEATSNLHPQPGSELRQP